MKPVARLLVTLGAQHQLGAPVRLEATREPDSKLRRIDVLAARHHHEGLGRGAGLSAGVLQAVEALDDHVGDLAQAPRVAHHQLLEGGDRKPRDLAVAQSHHRHGAVRSRDDFCLADGLTGRDPARGARAAAGLRRKQTERSVHHDVQAIGRLTGLKQRGAARYREPLDFACDLGQDLRIEVPQQRQRREQRREVVTLQGAQDHRVGAGAHVELTQSSSVTDT